MSEPERGFNPNDHLTNLKGKDYLEVRWRIVWLRKDHPEASIETELLKLEPGFALFKATVTVREGTSWQCTGHGSETKDDFGDYIEKAETKAIGRALGAAGYGTAATFDEDPQRAPADAPVDFSKTRRTPTPNKVAAPPSPLPPADRETGNILDGHARETAPAKQPTPVATATPEQVARILDLMSSLQYDEHRKAGRLRSLGADRWEDVSLINAQGLIRNLEEMIPK